MRKHARKRSVNTLSSSDLYMFIKKEQNLRLTIYKIEIMCAGRHARYCARWAPKVILSAQFFSVPNGHVSSNCEVCGVNFWRPGDSNLTCKQANKYANVRERVEVVEKNKDDPLPDPVVPLFVSVCERKPRKKKDTSSIVVSSSIFGDVIEI